MPDETEDSALAYLRRRIISGNRLSAILNAYAALGMTIALLGFGYLAYRKLNIQLTSQEQTALLAGFAGMAMAVLSLAASNYRKALLQSQRIEYDQYATVSRFLEAWNAFEDASRRGAFGDGPGETRSFRETLAALKQQGKLSNSDIFEAEELLRIRNSLVHGSKNISSDTARVALEKVVDILARL